MTLVASAARVAGDPPAPRPTPVPPSPPQPQVDRFVHRPTLIPHPSRTLFPEQQHQAGRRTESHRPGPQVALTGDPHQSRWALAA